jgi:hypothetical protein
MAAKLTEETDHPDELVVKEFAQCVQVLLRRALGKLRCSRHERFPQAMHEPGYQGWGISRTTLRGSGGTLHLVMHFFSR